MTREWLETIRELAHKSTLGELLMIAPPGKAESDNMRRRLDLLADFAQHVVESVDDDELRAARESRDECVAYQDRAVRTRLCTAPRQPDCADRHMVTRMATDSPSLVDNTKQSAGSARKKGGGMRYWQHGETGRLCAMETSPSPRYHEITGDQYEAETTGSRSDPQVPDRRTGPPDRRLNGHGLLWFGFEAERSSAPGRRSSDKYHRQEPELPLDRCT